MGSSTSFRPRSKAGTGGTWRKSKTPGKFSRSISSLFLFFYSAVLPLLHHRFNKVWIPAFVYHTLRYVWYSENIAYGCSTVSLQNTALTLPMLFIIYDFFYSFFHRALHHRSIYAPIHKHHHQQMVPTNGIEDAINEHPFEYLVGEYLHLLAIAIVSNLVTLHVAAIGVFALGAGFLPALNHTRMDVSIPGFYRSKHHDQHHVYPT